MSNRSVLKFGGSSMSQPEVCADIFTDNPMRNTIAVVSAIGKNPDSISDQVKVTDLLIGLEDAVDNHEESTIQQLQEAVIEKSRETYSMLGSRALNDISDHTYNLLKPERRSEGYKWIGEHVSAKLFAELTGAVYMPTELRFSGGVLQVEKSIKAIAEAATPIIRAKRQAVSEGFYGYDIATGKVTMLPRGGSDISAIVVTAALNRAGIIGHINENYTDKNGILSADPDIVPSATVIPVMTHNEAREKMHGIYERNGVVHGDAIAYADTLDVEMYVKNTFDPSETGTHIVQKRASSNSHPVIGISGKNNISAINVYDLGMADAENYVGAILNHAGKLGMSFANLPTAEDRLKITFNKGADESNLESIQKFIEANAISGQRAEVSIIHNQGAVYIVGQELTDPVTYTKILGEVATGLAKSGFAMKEVISHENSPSVALTVEGNEVPDVIRLLHENLIERYQQ